MIVINVVMGAVSLEEIGLCNYLIKGARFTVNCPITLSEHIFAEYLEQNTVVYGSITSEEND